MICSLTAVCKKKQFCTHEALVGLAGVSVAYVLASGAVVLAVMVIASSVA